MDVFSVDRSSLSLSTVDLVEAMRALKSRASVSLVHSPAARTYTVLGERNFVSQLSSDSTIHTLRELCGARSVHQKTPFASSSKSGYPSELLRPSHSLTKISFGRLDSYQLGQPSSAFRLRTLISQLQFKISARVTLSSPLITYSVQLANTGGHTSCGSYILHFVSPLSSCCGDPLD